MSSSDILTPEFLLSSDTVLLQTPPDVAKWLAPRKDLLDKAIASLTANGHTVVLVDSGAEALDALVSRIAPGESVNTAGSTTLEQIGFVGALKTNAKAWRNVKDEILAEPDQAKQFELRRTLGLTVDVHVTSVTAIDATTGKLYVADALGNRVAPLILGPKRVLIVTSLNKLVDSDTAARQRIRDFAMPLVSAAVRQKYGKFGWTGTALTHEAVIDKSPLGRGHTIILITNEQYGY